MNYANYAEKKEKELCEVIKVGEAFAFVSKKFDIETGESIAPETEALEVEQLNKRKVELQKEIDAINLIVIDIQALDIDIQALDIK